MKYSTTTINSGNGSSTFEIAAAKCQQKYYEMDIANKKEKLALAHKLIKREKALANLVIQAKMEEEIEKRIHPRPCPPQRWDRITLDHLYTLSFFFSYHYHSFYLHVLLQSLAKTHTQHPRENEV